jgi:hypothetical protein
LCRLTNDMDLPVVPTQVARTIGNATSQLFNEEIHENDYARGC